jgi:hypothetical protein
MPIVITPTNKGRDSMGGGGMDIGNTPKSKKTIMKKEAVGEPAEAFYDLLDDLGIESNVVLDELARYLSQDQIAEFADDFRRNHDMNHPGEDGSYGDDDANFESNVAEGHNAIMYKGKEIDTARLDYDMQDISDGIYQINAPAYYTDGTEIADGDYDDLYELPELNDWILQNYTSESIEESDFDDLNHILKLAGQPQKMVSESKKKMIKEGRMSDIHQDAQEMDKEEFTAKYPMFASMWDEVHSDNDDEKYANEEAESATEEAESATVAVPVQELVDIMRLAGLDASEKVEEYANEPEEQYMDAEEQLIGLSGGLNGPKTHYPAAAGGDNPMSVKALKVSEASIEEGLYKKYVDFIKEEAKLKEKSTTGGFAGGGNSLDGRPKPEPKPKTKTQAQPKPDKAPKVVQPPKSKKGGFMGGGTDMKSAFK